MRWPVASQLPLSADTIGGKFGFSWSSEERTDTERKTCLLPEYELLSTAKAPFVQLQLPGEHVYYSRATAHG